MWLDRCAEKKVKKLLIDDLRTGPSVAFPDEVVRLPYSQAAYDADNGPKELYLVKGATHVDMYDKEPYVSEAVVKLTDFFNKNLNEVQ